MARSKTIICGFRTTQSYISALIDLLEEMRSKADNNMISFLVLFDHSNAFDTIDHTIPSHISTIK